jgi:UPF0716 family protein affecting phage T7 exclusion
MLTPHATSNFSDLARDGRTVRESCRRSAARSPQPVAKAVDSFCTALAAFTLVIFRPAFATSEI